MLLRKGWESSNMKTFKQYLNEAGGQAAGTVEIAKTSLEDAKKWVEKKGFDLSELPNFDKNYKIAQAAAKKGSTKRKDMPVITDADVKKMQSQLKGGKIDIHTPHSDDTKPSDPFPEGLKGKEAKDFLNNGLKDGDKKDDVVKVSSVKKKVSDLIPIQKQIFFDKSMGGIIDNGVENTKKFIGDKSFFITSTDNFIIDGHHRFLAAMLVDPKMTVNTLSIDLPISKLLPVSLAFGDAIGNKRNA